MKQMLLTCFAVVTKEAYSQPVTYALLPKSSHGNESALNAYQLVNIIYEYTFPNVSYAFCRMVKGLRLVLESQSWGHRP